MNFVTIRDILEHLQRGDSDKELKDKELIAFIFDATKPRKVQGTGDYMQTLKIMDGSYNGYLTLFFFTKDYDECGPFDQVGDIVLLKRYSYSLYNGEPQARRNTYKTSKLLLFEANNQQLKFNPNDSAQITSDQQEKINQIHSNCKQFFEQNSLLNLHWYGSTNPFYDVLLQVQEYKENNIVIVNDQDSVQYKLKCQTLSTNQLPVGTILKLRNIQISLENEILINDKTNLMIVPEYSLDKTQFQNVKQTIVKIDATQEFYLQMTDNSLTQIKKKHFTLPTINLIDLINNQNQNSIVHIQAQVQSIFPTKVKDALIFYNKYKSFSYNEYEKENLPIAGLHQTFQIQLNLRDQSLNNTLLVMQVVLFGCDEFYPFRIDIHNIEYMQQQYDQFMEKLVFSEYNSDFIIEQIQGNGINLFTVIDTKYC